MKKQTAIVLAAWVALSFFSVGSAHGWQMISFNNLDAVDDDQIVYTFLKNSYFAQSLEKRQESPFHYALGKCTLTASSEKDGVLFQMNSQGADSAPIALKGTLLEVGNESAFVKYFREEMKKLSCM